MYFCDPERHRIAILKALAGEYADSYAGDFLLPAHRTAMRAREASVEEIRAHLLSPYGCLQTFLTHYAFARRGRDKEEIAEIAHEALLRCCPGGDCGDLLNQPDGSELWEQFEALCSKGQKRNSEQLNRGLTAGIAELAQEIYRGDGVGSICGWIVNGALETGRIEGQFLRIVDIRGVGPKATSTFLRDIAFLFDLEEKLDHVDRLFVQPIDRWIRLLAPYVVPDEDIGDAADWVLAGKVAKYARRAAVSGIRYNMGALYFGIREVRNPACLESAVLRLVDPQPSVARCPVSESV